MAWVCLALAGCASVDVVTPERAIAWAAAEPGGRETTVRMVVRNVDAGVGAEAGGFYLNSFPDYRDPRSLNVIVSARAAAELAAAGVTDPRAEYLGREVLVRGVVRRVEISRVDENGRVVGEPYAQTQLQVWGGAQVVRADTGRAPAGPPTIDIRRANEATYLAADPGNPARALYQHELQKRIDAAFAREVFAAQVGEGLAVAPGRRVLLRVKVLPDGRLAADTEELKVRLAAEPILARVMLRALLEVSERPKPFPETVRATTPGGFDYEAVFAIE